jgi:hypothetical protein
MRPETEKLVDLVIDVGLILFAIFVMTAVTFGYAEDDIVAMMVVAMALLIRILGYLSRIHRSYVT